jgi:YNFM family putative membrane transporter
MFATMYSTQAILPELESGLGCSAAAAGLSITVVVFAVAIFGWLYGPLSDRAGRVRVMIGSAAAIVVPTALLAVVPGLPVFLALRAAQGALMPGLLVVAVPYVAERFRGPGQGRQWARTPAPWSSAAWSAGWARRSSPARSAGGAHSRC